MRYIGSKVGLLPAIDKLLQRKLDGDEESFLDLFGGTNSVGEYFKPNFKIYSNDALYFSYADATARIRSNRVPSFLGLRKRGVPDPFRFLREGAESSLGQSEVGYYEQNYSPTGGARYFSVENAKRIDFIRETISMWKRNEWIDEVENCFLISSLISAIPSVSNTTGTYGAFLKHWDKRALKPLFISPLRVVDNGRENRSFNRDANDLVKEVNADIIYIDPPYNGRQYAANYHLLENIARDTRPELKGVTRLFDWSGLKSSYSIKRKAAESLEDLLSNANCRHVILSYNTEGLVPRDELESIAKRHSFGGAIEITEIPYRKYKSKVPSEVDELKELLIYFRKDGRVKKTVKRSSQEKVVGRMLDNSDTESIGSVKWVKSPLNYIGGKYRLLGQILPLLPSQSNTFVDLFSGGANVGINVRANNHVFNDMNTKVNEMFRLFQTHPVDELIETVHNTINTWHLSKTNEESFKSFREYYNANPDPLSLYVLSSFSYNYQFRFNSKMEFNNPFGRNRSSFSKNMEKNLRLFCERLKNLNAEFTDCYFEDFDYSVLKQGDFVYADPPYLITTGSYNDGNRGFRNWDESKELQLTEVLSRLTTAGVPFALSNVVEHKGRINSILSEYIKRPELNVHYLNFNYDNSSHNSKTTGSQEVLVTNYTLDEAGRAKVNSTD